MPRQPGELTDAQKGAIEYAARGELLELLEGSAGVKLLALIDSDTVSDIFIAGIRAGVTAYDLVIHQEIEDRRREP